MHPIILFDARNPENWSAPKRQEKISWPTASKCGGSITGEHGVGMEKNELMGRLFPADTLAAIQSFKDLFDPENRLNPGKVLPTGKGCLEIRQAPLVSGSRTY